jgi:Flp pilus assembly protein TadD/glutathione synthase/RimK-type ligase-like ATP-grasp enzyme
MHTVQSHPEQSFPLAKRGAALAIAALWERGVELELLGRLAEARETWIALLNLEPSHAGALNRLGALLAAAGENHLAQEVFSEAVRQHPADPATRVSLANVLIRNGEHAGAREHLEQALRLDLKFRPAHAGLAFALHRLGEPELARWHGRVAFRGRCVAQAPYRGDGKPIRVLELISTRGGNVRIQNFLSDRVFQRSLVAAEFYEPEAPLPAHDLVVNAIGDADLASVPLAAAAALVRHTDAPVINAPAAVMATGRAAVAQRLAAPPGVIAPRMAMLERAVVGAPDRERSLVERGFAFPLLLRSPGFHGGENLIRVDHPTELAAAAAALPGHELLAMEFLDARGADGKFRKYRAMMIDGRIYPLHCAVSSNWKVHYFSADMADSAEHRAEDAAFLGDMGGMLGPRAMGALHAIQDELNLDYGGIDFGLDRDGNLLLFEANATMVILPPGAEAKWDYRRPAVREACAAVDAMLRNRAGREATAGASLT